MDSGATDNWVPDGFRCTSNKKRDEDPSYVTTAGSDMLKSTHTAQLPLPINSTGSECKVLPGMSGHDALLSVGKIADSGYELVFNEQTCYVFPKSTVSYDPQLAVMEAPRDTSTDLYQYNMSQQNNRHASVAKRYQHRISHEDQAATVRYWSHVFGNPTDSTFYHAISQHSDIHIDGLTAQVIKKNLPHSVETDVGHMRLKPSNLDSSKKLKNKRFRTIRLTTKEFFDAYSDLAGRFPHISADGYEYILIFIHYTGYIFIRAIKSRSGKAQAEAYDSILSECKQRNVLPKTYMLDNEISPEVRAVLLSYQVDAQTPKADKERQTNLATPENKRANMAERVMDIVKPHIVSTVAGCDIDFPIKAWNLLLPQVETTLNLLRTSTVNPQVSCYGTMYGTYDFDKCPLAPAGVKVMYYKHPHLRQTWGHKSALGFVVGPALEHHRCFTIVDFFTGMQRVTDTLSFHPQKYRMPGSSQVELVTAAIQQLADILKSGLDPTDKSYEASNNLLQSLLKYKDIYEPINPPVTGDRQYRPGINIPATSTRHASPRVTDSNTREHGASAELPVTAEPAEIPRVNDELSMMKDELPRVTDKNPSASEDEDEPDEPTADANHEQANPNSSDTQQEVKPMSHVYSKAELDGMSLSAIKEICHQLGIKTRLNSISATLTTEIMRVQGTKHHMLQPRRRSKTRANKKSTAYAATTNEISGWELLDRLPRPTVPQPFQRGYWQEVKHLEKVVKTAWGWNNSAKTAITNEFTTRDHSKPKYNYSKEKRNNPELVESAEHSELSYFMDTGCTTEHIGPVPKKASVTYYNPQLEYKIDQDGKLVVKIRGAGGGDRVTTDTDNVSRSTEPILVKTFLNAAVSEDAYIATIDLGKFFLHEKLPDTDMVFLKLTETQVPKQTVDKYKLTWQTDKKGKKFIMLRCLKAIYGLPQANKLAYEGLKANLAKYGYYETSTKCLFRHETKAISFIVHVDDFAVKVKKVEEVHELVQALTECGYKVKTNIPFINTEGRIKSEYKFVYTGLTCVHNMKQRYMDLSLPDYEQFLRRQIPEHIKPRSTPGTPHPIQYGQKQQFVQTDKSVSFSPEQLQRLQTMVGQYGWYAKQVAHDLLTAIAILSTHQSNPTEQTEQAMINIQGYLKGWGKQTIRFHASEMILTVMSDASLGSEKENKNNHRSRAACIMYLGTSNPNIINGPIFIHTGILPGVPTSAAEAEIAGNFESGKHTVYARKLLDDLGYAQPTTVIFTDNVCSLEYSKDTIKGTKLRHIDRRSEWIKHMVNCSEFELKYISSENNLADFFTKLMTKQRHEYLLSFIMHKEKVLKLQTIKILY